jgi:hypothetical protein
MRTAIRPIAMSTSAAGSGTGSTLNETNGLPSMLDEYVSRSRHIPVPVLISESVISNGV